MVNLNFFVQLEFNNFDQGLIVIKTEKIIVEKLNNLLGEVQVVSLISQTQNLMP